jgi:hypothetical protein
MQRTGARHQVSHERHRVKSPTIIRATLHAYDALHFSRDQFHPPPAPVPLWRDYNPEIMITYWCSKKNSIHNWIEHGIDFVPFSVPCIRSECEYWRNGECIHLTIKGK